MIVSKIKKMIVFCCLYFCISNQYAIAFDKILHPHPQHSHTLKKTVSASAPLGFYFLQVFEKKEMLAARQPWLFIDFPEKVFNLKLLTGPPKMPLYCNGRILLCPIAGPEAFKCMSLFGEMGNVEDPLFPGQNPAGPGSVFIRNFSELSTDIRNYIVGWLTLSSIADVAGYAIIDHYQTILKNKNIDFFVDAKNGSIYISSERDIQKLVDLAIEYVLHEYKEKEKIENEVLSYFLNKTVTCTVRVTPKPFSFSCNNIVFDVENKRVIYGGNIILGPDKVGKLNLNINFVPSETIMLMRKKIDNKKY